MTLEDFTAPMNGSTFWKEFTFSRNLFSPQPGQELELADNFIWLGDTAFVIQMKERERPTDNPEMERRWFKSKVLRKATGQIKDSIRFLDEHDTIYIANERGQRFAISGQKLRHLEKIVLYAAGPALPDECRGTRSHVSETAGFIHVIERNDYRLVLETLRVPDEVRRYLKYREAVLPPLKAADIEVRESDILAAYMSDEPIPSPLSHLKLGRLLDDNDRIDLSPIMSRLADHIQNPGGHDYTRILLEFAKLPRSAWRAARERLDLSINAAKNEEFMQPYRFHFPETDCSFVFSPIFPGVPSVGPEGLEARSLGLQGLTAGAKYLSKASRGVGVLVSKDGEFVHLDWCLIDEPWEHDPLLEECLAAANPFREVREKRMDGYYFIEGTTDV